MRKSSQDNQLCDIKKTYVYNNTEVVLTGRTASKKLLKTVDVLYEVKPIDGEQGSWKKWIRFTELYEIEDNK